MNMIWSCIFDLKIMPDMPELNWGGGEKWHSSDSLSMNITVLFLFFSSLFYGNELNSQLWLKLRIGFEKVHYFYSQAVFQVVAPRDDEMLKQL